MDAGVHPADPERGVPVGDDVSRADHYAVDAHTVDTWVRAGIISPDQARRIRDFTSPPPRHDRGVARDILGYVGAALVVIAGAIIVVDSWGDMDRGARFLVSAGAAIALVVAGALLDRAGDATARRLSETSLMLAAAPVGLSCGLIADIWTDPDAAVAIGFVSAAIYASIGYTIRPSWAQQIALFVTVAGSVISIGAYTRSDQMWMTGLAVVLVGVVWLAASLAGRLPPRLLAELAGVASVGLGSLITVGELDSVRWSRITLGLWIASSLAVMMVGVRRDRMVLVAGGIVGLIVYIPWLAVDTFGEGIGVPLALLAVGIGLSAVAVVLSRRTGAHRD